MFKCRYCGKTIKNKSEIKDDCPVGKFGIHTWISVDDYVNHSDFEEERQEIFDDDSVKKIVESMVDDEIIIDNKLKFTDEDNDLSEEAEDDDEDFD
ncbi:MAG TPA: hypothetical protein PLS66_04850 [Tepiditoga sp.]|nr:hypothetical protein [Thermotogota bacterium]HOO74600.1 hypothetical protein [Tepiditoga sp.]